MSQKKPLLNNENMPVIDWELCVRLANNKSEIAQEILAFVLQQLSADRNTIQEAYNKLDYPELLRSVHKLHGALCYTGLPRLKRIIFEFENLLKKKDLDKEKLSSMMESFEGELALVLESTGSFLSKL